MGVDTWRVLTSLFLGSLSSLPLINCGFCEGMHCILHGRIGRQHCWLVLASGKPRIIRPVCTLRGERLGITQSSLFHSFLIKRKKAILGLCCSLQYVLNHKLSIFLKKTSRVPDARALFELGFGLHFLTVISILLWVLPPL